MRRMMTIGVLACAMTACMAGAASAAAARTYAAGRYALELHGVFVGYVSLIEGGQATSDVVREPSDEYYFVKKHLGTTGYRDIVLEFGANMTPAVYEWMKQALAATYSPKDGAILALDFNGKIVGRLDFYGAQITGITFPGVNAASKDEARFALRLTPVQTVRQRKLSGAASATTKIATQRRLNTAAFRFSIDGLDTKAVSRVDAIAVQLPLRTDPNAVCLRCEPMPPAKIDFPAVVFTLAETKADSIYAWFEDFVIKGINDDLAEKGGTLEYLSPNYQSTFFTVSFGNLGIVEIAPPTEGASDQIQRVTVTTYAETMDFSYGGGSL